jgi:hypothetical protein
MALLTKTHRIAPPNALANELIDAREQYNAVRTSVIDRAVQRQNAIEETITDLRVEDESLETVVQDARKG